MEPTLLVIGLNHRTASLDMRERFWIGENRRYEILRLLQNADGIEEAVVLSTRCRTEFLLWASEPTLAANSILQFLSCEYGLKLSEWEHFYRRLGEAALIHIFRVASGLDSLVLGEPQVISQMKDAWEQAQTVGASGKFLNAIIDKALQVSDRVRQETAVGKLGLSIPMAAMDVAKQVFGSLEGRRVLLLGTGKMNELAARSLAESGVASVVVIDQSATRAEELAARLGATAAPMADRWKQMVASDIVISATGCPHVLLTREEAELIAQERNRVALVILDIDMPRDVDPEVRRVDGIVLHDLDGLERAVNTDVEQRATAAAEAENIVAAEARTFRAKLQDDNVVPTSVALRRRLEEICRQELESFIAERGPFSREQDQSLHAIACLIYRKIASSLTRELKDVPEKAEQERITAAVVRLFHLDPPQQASAGTKSERGQNQRRKERAVAING